MEQEASDEIGVVSHALDEDAVDVPAGTFVAPDKIQAGGAFTAAALAVNAASPMCVVSAMVMMMEKGSGEESE